MISHASAIFKPHVFLTFLLAFALSAGAETQEFETRIFVLKARTAESTVEMVQTLLSPGGKVVPETRLNKLVVRDTPEVLMQVESLLEEIDQHLPQVRISVTTDGVSQTSGSTVGVGVGSSHGRTRVTGTAVAGTSRSDLHSVQNVVVMSGERGMIHIARQVANPNPYVQFAVESGLIHPGYAFSSVGTGFAVEPIVVGDVVRVTVTPWFSFATGQTSNEVLVNQASSTFAVKSGDSINIASGGYQESLKTRAFGLVLGVNGLSSENSATVTLRPEILDY
jgi:hypothetical protein